MARRCAVIGAGVIGSCLALRLAEAGAEVTLLDQDEPGQATSKWSFAWLNSNDKAPRAYHELNHTAPGWGPGPRWPLSWAARPGTGPPGTWSGRRPPPGTPSSPPG
jgi:glycine/D-amino acid oxidase-like deaminating enzyme